MGNNTACQRLECYYRSFCQGCLNHLTELLSIGKDRISNFQNSHEIPFGFDKMVEKNSKINDEKRLIE